MESKHNKLIMKLPIPNTDKYKIKDEKPDSNPPRLDWNDYHRLDVIHAFMDNLESDFPSICTVGVIGTSLEGRNLKVLKVSNSDASNSSVWMDAGIHAREWIAPAVATYVADNIVRNFNDLPISMTNKDWYFLPVVNPDGYEYSHTKDRMWRKNRAWHGGQCVGVDLNRNFSYGWGGKGSSDMPTNAFYRGPSPFSEPESSAVRDILSQSGISFKVYVTLHSYGQVIIFPFAFREELCPDYMRLLEGATVMSKAIYESCGNTYKVGISRDVMYGAAGTSNDWSYGAAGVPYCYLIELRSKQHKFKLPKEEIEVTGNEILACIKALMDFVDKTPINEEKLGKVAPSNYKTQVWEVKLTNEGHRYFVKTLDTAGGYMSTCDQLRTELWFGNKSVTVVMGCSDHLTSVAHDFSCALRYEYNKESFKAGSMLAYFLVLQMYFGDALNIWKEERSTMDVMVDGPRSAQVAGMLHEREIPYAVAIGDVGGLLEKEQGGSFAKTRKGSELRRSMDWKNFHRLDVIYAFMDNLAKEYPYLCAVVVIGKSAEGRDLRMLKVSNGNSDNAGVWIDGSIHPREWISAAVVTYIADKLVRTFHEQPDTVVNKNWYILPVMNPDGYEYTHTHDRMWRKNRARYGDCVGVDLNRNFSYGWGEKGEEGSSEDPGNIFFRGPKPFSEPETVKVKRVILNSEMAFKVFLSFHSYGEVIIFPWGYTGDPCPDYVELLEGGTSMAKAIFETSGHTYKVGSTKDLMYYAAGTSTDWSYAVANIPYSYMVELRGKKHRFLLPKEEIVSTASEAMSGVMRLMDFVDKRCRSSQSCVCPK